jgi:hypothetical protein
VSVCLLDTSILCEILEVPTRCDNRAVVLAQMEEKVKGRESLLLPMSAIVETGNHIGQNGDGRQRRAAADRFVGLVQQAIRGKTPFTPTPFFETDALLEWLAHFPDWAMRGAGLADLTIAREFERQCALHRQRRVYIWSLDEHLSSYNREP